MVQTSNLACASGSSALKNSRVIRPTTRGRLVRTTENIPFAVNSKGMARYETQQEAPGAHARTSSIPVLSNSENRESGSAASSWRLPNSRILPSSIMST